MFATEVPKAHTPPGGYGSEMPPPVLAGCDEPLEVTRRLDGNQLVWTYGPMFTARLEPIA